MEGDKNTSCSHLHVYRQLLSHHTRNTAAEQVTCSEHLWLWFHYHGRNTQLQWRKKCLCMYVCTEFIYRMFWRVRRQVRWRRGDPAAEPRWHQWCSRSDWWRQEQKKLIYWQLSVRLQPVHDINHRNVLKRLVSVELWLTEGGEKPSPAWNLEIWSTTTTPSPGKLPPWTSPESWTAKQGERMNKRVIEGWKSRQKDRSVDQTAANWRKETKNKNLRQKHRNRITVESLCWSVGPIPQLLVSINN